MSKTKCESEASFASKVFEVVRAIPSGETLSYKEVARKAGNASAARAVGNILQKNFDSTIPCHRVIRSNGAIGGYNRGAKRKRELLKKEAHFSQTSKMK